MTRDAATSAVVWGPLLGGDPLPWLLASDEPAARWVTLTGVLDRPGHDPEVLATRAAVVADPGTAELLGRLPDWEADNRLSGHDSPRFAPNLLNLLADMGVQEGDDPRVGRLLEQLLAHQEPSGRFPSFAASRAGEAPVWGALLCDSHAVVEVLVRNGRSDDPRTRAGLARMAADLAPTTQGRAWPCLPHPVTGFRGPGRKGDFCPQVTLEALRTFAGLPEHQRPEGLLEVAGSRCAPGGCAGASSRTCSGTAGDSRPSSGRSPGTAPTACWTRWAATRHCDVAGTPALATAQRSPSWPPAWSPTTPARTAPSRPGRPGVGSRPSRSGRRSAPRPSPPLGCLQCCTAWTTWPPSPPPSTIRTLGSSKGGSGVAVPPRPPVTAGRRATCST
jgi:hypothetical protein